MFELPHAKRIRRSELEQSWGHIQPISRETTRSQSEATTSEDSAKADDGNEEDSNQGRSGGRDKLEIKLKDKRSQAYDLAPRDARDGSVAAAEAFRQRLGEFDGIAAMPDDLGGAKANQSGMRTGSSVPPSSSLSVSPPDHAGGIDKSITTGNKDNGKDKGQLSNQNTPVETVRASIDNHPRQDENEDKDDGEEELEFRLFAPSASRPSGPGGSSLETTTFARPQRIRLRSLSPSSQNQGFVVPERPLSYYFTHPGDGDTVEEEAQRQRLEEYAAVAVNGEDVVVRSKTPWPGCALPWRVQHVRVRGTKGLQGSKHSDIITGEGSEEQAALVLGDRSVTTGVVSEVLDSSRPKRRRLGKKSRIAKRKRLKREEGKEVEERAKKSRRNREKKLKKRERDKVKKAKAKEEGGEVDEGGSTMNIT
ncbi:MAG: hypothetical protein M1820_003535 [Bogoriella megaspora]|nr:MAG: hypothetical protein M1820_003535 [Bogoriella megaspora]